MHNWRLFIPSDNLDNTSAALWCDEDRKDIIGGISPRGVEVGEDE